MSNAVVRLYKDAFGRGPTKARAQFAGPDTLVFALEDSMTVVERNLAAMGEHGRLRDARMFFQYALEEEFRAIVERELGRRTVAFVSGIDTRHDISIAVLTLEPRPAGGAAAPTSAKLTRRAPARDCTACAGQERDRERRQPTRPHDRRGEALVFQSRCTERADVVLINGLGRGSEPHGDAGHHQHAGGHAPELPEGPGAVWERVDAEDRRPHHHRRQQVQGVLGLVRVVVAQGQTVDRREVREHDHGREERHRADRGGQRGHGP